MVMESILNLVKRSGIILLVLVLFPSCTKRFLVSRVPERVDSKVLNSWKKGLEGKVTKMDINKIDINISISYCQKIREQVRDKINYEYKWRNDFCKNVVKTSALLGCIGVVTAFSVPEDADKSAALSLLLGSAGLIAVPLLLTMNKGNKEREYGNTTSKTKTDCDNYKNIENKPVMVTVPSRDREKYYTNDDGNISISTKKIFPYLSKSNPNITLDISYQDEKIQITVSLMNILKDYINAEIISHMKKHRETFSINIMDANTHYPLINPEPNLKIFSVSPSSDASAKKIAWDVANETSRKYGIDASLAKSIAYDVATSKVSSYAKTEVAFPITKENISNAEYTFPIIRYPRSTNINVRFSVMHPEYHFLEKTVRWTSGMSGINVFMSEVGSKIRVEEVKGSTGGVEPK